MFKKLTAQNFNGENYTALDFSESGAVLYLAKNGDLSLLKRFIQLMWASTIEDGIGTTFSLKSQDHLLSSTEENIFLDNNPVKIAEMEAFYGMKFSDYGKLFVGTYTQLLNLELARISPNNYLQNYVFVKSDAKSYYSPLEDIFYDIEQARKYSDEVLKNSNVDLQKEKQSKIELIQKQIEDLELQKKQLVSGIVQNTNPKDTIAHLENQLEGQRKKDMLLAEKEKLLTEIESLDNTIKDYERKLSRLSKVDIDMEKYNRFVQLDAHRVENDINMFIYRIREREKALSDMANQRVTYHHTTTHLAVLPALILFTISISVGLTIAILSNVMIGLLLGMVLSAMSILYLVFNKGNSKVNSNVQVMTHERVSAIANEIDALKSAKLRYLNNLGLNNEDDYYATKALVRAVLYQKETDLAKIHENFDGKELSDFRTLYNQKKDSLLSIQIEADKYGPLMAPDEYIRKKRELDMLKLEDMSSEKPINSTESLNAKIQKLHMDLQRLMSEGDAQNNDDVESTYINILNEYYGADSVDTIDEFVTNVSGIANYERKVELFILQRLAYIKAKYLHVELPLFLEDPFVGIENDALIKKILDFCQSKIQVILISEHANYADLGLPIINSSK